MAILAQNILKQHFSAAAKHWISEYEISSTPLTEGQVLALSLTDRDKVWSAMQDWVSSQEDIDGKTYEYRYGFPLVPGYEPGCDDYYLGNRTSDTDSSVIFGELRVFCQECSGEGVDEEREDCEACEGEGEMIYDLDFASGSFES